MVGLRGILIFVGLLTTFTVPAFAQDEGLEVFLQPKKFYKKFFPNLRIKKPAFDSTYIKTYPNYLTTGAHLILPTINLDIQSQSSVEDASKATSNFRTNIGSILAFNVGYRFIGAGFAMVLSSSGSGKEDYASTSFRTATIKYNGAAYYLQFKYMRTIGFTDVNSFNSSDPGVPYTKRDDLRSKEFQFEGMYNFAWKKYSYYASIDYTQRQLKSSFGPLLKAGAYYNELSANANLLTPKQRQYFEEFEDIKMIRSTSFKLAPGIGANLVLLRKLYLSAAAFMPYNIYIYNYFNEAGDRVEKGASIALVIDGNVSLGYQSERIYAGVRYQADSKQLKMNTIIMNTKFSYFGFDIGYRFKAPKIVKKIYKDTMPPGM